MSFINALVAAAKNAGISPGELYAQSNRGYKPNDLSDGDISSETPNTQTHSKICRRKTFTCAGQWIEEGYHGG